MRQHEIDVCWHHLQETKWILVMQERATALMAPGEPRLRLRCPTHDAQPCLSRTGDHLQLCQTDKKCCEALDPLRAGREKAGTSEPFYAMMTSTQGSLLPNSSICELVIFVGAVSAEIFKKILGALT